MRESLDGWWHAFFDSQARWFMNGPAELGILHMPSGGWDSLLDYKESVPVPGSWHDRRPGYCGVVWYQRPVVLPDEWPEGRVFLQVEQVRTFAQIYFNRGLVYAGDGSQKELTACLGDLKPGDQYDICICVWHTDDTGGITGKTFLLSLLD